MQVRVRSTGGLDGLRLVVAGWLLTEADLQTSGGGADRSSTPAGMTPDGHDPDPESLRIMALVELSRDGDKEAFGLLYDHYHVSVFRFLYYRTHSTTLAEDLTSDTFFRALRSMSTFQWQGKDFGAWLMTIARNLVIDHFKSGKSRLEHTVDDMSAHDDAHDGPEVEVMASITNELLLEAIDQLPAEQRDCVIMRFLQGMSIADTAAALGRTEGAIKQLQLRGVRNLAKLVPEGLNR